MAFNIHRPAPETNTFVTDLGKIADTTDTGIEYLWDQVGTGRGRWTPIAASIGLQANSTTKLRRTRVDTRYTNVDGRAFVRWDVTLADSVNALHFGLPVVRCAGAIMTSAYSERQIHPVEVATNHVTLAGQLAPGRYLISARYLTTDIGHTDATSWRLGASVLGHDTILGDT